jgi:hypothetical protein
MKFEERILDKLDIIQDDINKIKIENVKQSLNIEINTKDLTEHKEGVIQNRERICKLEEPYLTKSNISWFIGVLSTISAITYTLYRLGLFN